MVTGGNVGPSGTAPSRRPPLDVLSRSVRDARAAVHQHRHGPVSAELTNARRELVHALQEYTSALEARHLPVPYALRAELRLQRRLFD